MKVLVIRLSSIGDIVLTSPVLRCLHEQVKDIELHMMVKAPFVAIAESNPHVDRTLVYGEPVSESYDCVVDLQENARSRKICRQLGVRRYTFSKRNVAKLLLTATKHRILPIEHVCDRYFDAVSALNVRNDGKGLDFYFGDEEPPMVQHPYVVMVVGANHFTKTIPVERLHFLASGCRKHVVLIGGKADGERLDRERLSWSDNVTNLCGKTSLAQSAAIIKGADMVVTPDTGMMHIATALGTPLVLLWGCTHPDYGFSPYQPKGSVISVVPQRCRCHPCSKLGHARCPRGHYNCMMHHNWDSLLEIIN